MADKPNKGEMAQWAMMPTTQYFFQELQRKFPVYASSYKFKSLEESREAAERALMFEEMAKVIQSE